MIFCCYQFYEENGTDFSFMGCHIILLGMLQFLMESMGMGIFSSPYSAVLSINISTNVKQSFVNEGKFADVSINSFLQLKLLLWKKGIGCSAVERQMVQVYYNITQPHGFFACIVGVIQYIFFL